MKTVWIVDGRVHEIIPQTDIPVDKRYPAEQVAQFVEAPDDVVEGMTWDGQIFAPYVSPPPSPDEVIAAVKSRLAAIDVRRVRPMGDILDGLGDVPGGPDNKTPRERLALLNAEAAALRAQL